MSRITDEVIALVPDIHLPYHLPRCTDLVLEYLMEHAVDRVVIIGDLLDAYGISRFDKDPRRRKTLQEEVELGKEFLATWRACLGHDLPMHLMEGNHEFRLPKYLRKVAPELGDVSYLTTPQLLDLKDTNIKWHSSGDPLVVGDKKGQVVITHGNRIRKQGGMTALAISDEREQSIICGHSHRMGLSYRTTANGIRIAAELGCLCDYRKMDYIDSVPNWQIGFALLHLSKKHHPHVDLHLIDRPYSRRPTVRGE